MIRIGSLLVTGALCAVSSAHAQTVTHYWNFSTTDDLVGGLATVEVGPADRSVNASYGEAYPGSGPSLNNVINGVSSGTGGYLEATAVSGGTPLLDFGTSSFSFSYWCFDDFATDQNGRGPRVFDCLDGTTTGVQLGTNNSNDWNYRCDDDTGRVVIFNQASPFQLPIDQWVHVACTVDRGASEVRAYVNGALQAMIPFNDTVNGLPAMGAVFATRDLYIGIINADGTQDQSQNQAIDDLAFYSGVLSAADAAALASGMTTPLSFGGGVGTNYCTPNPNSTGVAGSMSAVGSEVASANNLTITASNLPPGQFGIFVVSDQTGLMNVGAGVLCLGGQIGRFNGPGQILQASAGGQFSLALDLTMIPTPTAFVSAMSGDTYYFQAWHRDGLPTAPSSNFTDGLQVDFL